MIVIDALGGATLPYVTVALSSIANATGNAADVLITYGNAISNVVDSTWMDVSGWIQGTANDVSKGVKNFLGFFG